MLVEVNCLQKEGKFTTATQLPALRLPSRILLLRTTSFTPSLRFEPSDIESACRNIYSGHKKCIIRHSFVNVRDNFKLLYELLFQPTPSRSADSLTRPFLRGLFVLRIRLFRPQIKVSPPPLVR